MFPGKETRWHLQSFCSYCCGLFGLIFSAKNVLDCFTLASVSTPSMSNMPSNSKRISLPPREIVYHNEPFTISNPEYNIQYYPFYVARLDQARPVLTRNAREQWPDVVVYSIADLADNKKDEDEEDEDGLQKGSSRKNSGDGDSQPLSQVDQEILEGKREVAIMGTLYKKMRGQPNILQELDNEKKNFEAEARTNYIADDDILYLQEGDECIVLKGDVKVYASCDIVIVS